MAFLHAAFQWDDTDDGVTLRDVTLDVMSGKLLGVCGAVGAGKSTLLAAMLGQVRKVAGDMRFAIVACLFGGSCAFLRQVIWVDGSLLIDVPAVRTGGCRSWRSSHGF